MRVMPRGKLFGDLVSLGCRGDGKAPQPVLGRHTAGNQVTVRSLRPLSDALVGGRRFAGKRDAGVVWKLIASLALHCLQAVRA